MKRERERYKRSPATGGMKKVENRYRQKRIFLSRTRWLLLTLPRSRAVSSRLFAAFHGRIEDMFTLAERNLRSTVRLGDIDL